MRPKPEHRPYRAEIHYNLGVALAARGRTDEALGHVRHAVALKPDFAPAHRQLGDLLPPKSAGRGPGRVPPGTDTRRRTMPSA